MKKLTYLFTFCSILFGLTINAQDSENEGDTDPATNLDGLSDAKSGGTNFANSLMLGHQVTDKLQGALLTAIQNVFVGYESGEDITQGDNNTALGYAALKNIRNAESNVAIGKDAGKLLIGGLSNVFIGSSSGDNMGTGADYNTIIGAGADVGSGDDAQQRIAIGKSAINTIDNTALIGKSTNTAVYFGGMEAGEWNSDLYANSLVLENSETITNATNGIILVTAGTTTFSGNVTVSSDMRLKDNILPLGSTMTNILKLDGKSYTRDGKEEIGLLAQDVQLVYPELVSEDANGMLSVNYQALSAILINGVKDQEARIQKLEILVKLLLENK